MWVMNVNNYVDSMGFFPNVKACADHASSTKKLILVDGKMSVDQSSNQASASEVGVKIELSDPIKIYRRCKRYITKKSIVSQFTIYLK